MKPVKWKMANDDETIKNSLFSCSLNMMVASQIILIILNFTVISKKRDLQISASVCFFFVFQPKICLTVCLFSSDIRIENMVLPQNEIPRTVQNFLRFNY